MILPGAARDPGGPRGEALHALPLVLSISAVKDEIARRLELNLTRVKSLIAAYETALPGGSGRPSVATTDILRASVVFLHSRIEDLLRSLLEWKWPTAKPEHLEEVPLDGDKLRKYTLSDIAKHRGKTVDELIEGSVKAALERSNFNSVDEVASVLTRSGVDTKTLAPFAADLEAMMKRRHWIVHRADRNVAQGSGQFPALSLHPNTVKAWLSAVDGFGTAVLALL
jgi:hypothetical protein